MLLRPRSCGCSAITVAAWQTQERHASIVAAAATALSPPPPPLTSVGHLKLDASKAGLQKVDKAFVEKVIHAATKGSAFYKSEQRKESLRTAKHRILVAKQKSFRRLSSKERGAWSAKAGEVERELEASRTFTRRYIHVDLDMFYAAVEEKFDPTLRDRPFAVGSFAMLATSNYIARQYGIRSGMPGFIAKKLCPKLWIVPLNFHLYRAEAAAVRAIAARYDPQYVTLGLDELTMDVTDYLATENAKRRRSVRRQATVVELTAEDACSEFRALVFAETGLTCSGGVAHTPAFAKLASNVHKPNGQHVMALHTREEVLHHVHDMPVRNTPGVGFATEQQLRALGIARCADFLTHKAELCYLFREKTFAFYLAAGLGVVRTHVDRAIAERRAAEAASKPPPDLSRPSPPKLLKAAAAFSAMKKKGRVASRSSGAPSTTLSHAASLQLAPLQKSTGKAVTVARGLPSEEAFRHRLRQLTSGAHAVLKQQHAGTRHVCFSTVDRTFEAHRRSKTIPRTTNHLPTLVKAILELAAPSMVRPRDFRLIGVNFHKLQRMPPREGTNIQKVAMHVQKESSVTGRLTHRYPQRKPKTPLTALVVAARATKVQHKLNTSRAWELPPQNAKATALAAARADATRACKRVQCAQHRQPTRMTPKKKHTVQRVQYV